MTNNTMHDLGVAWQIESYGDAVQVLEIEVCATKA
jgi:hypothetical protein